MRNLLVLIGILVCLAAVQVVFAQGTDGVITYEAKINLHRRIPPGQEARKAMIPEFRSSKHQLFFNANESFYKPIIEDEEEDMVATPSGGGGMRFRMQQPNEETYINTGNTTITTKREFMGKEYLIEDTLKISPWKLGTETKEIQGYLCKMAWYVDERQPDRKLEITAWYTDQLRPMLGPELFGSLPGTVLAVDINNGERTVVARQVEFRNLKKNEMKVPSGGQKVTPAEFRKIVDEAMKQMGGRGGVVIRN
jgi:GLPGLI family protein